MNEELSQEQRVEIMRLANSMEGGEIETLALLSKYPPRKMDLLIMNLKEVQLYFEDLEYISIESDDTQNRREVKRRIEMIDDLIELLRMQRDSHEENFFYNRRD